MYSKDKDEVIYQLKKQSIISIIRMDTYEKALQTAEAIIEGGIKVLEFSFTMNFAQDLISQLVKKYSNSDVIIGAGTILDPESAKIAFNAGAEFIISPYLNIETVKACLRYRKACIPGAMTIKETADCMEAGADMVKIFPSELFGPAIIKAIKGPLPYTSLVPTGGITIDNIDKWIESGSDAVGIGTNLTKPAENDDYSAITELSNRYVKKINLYKNPM